MAIFFSGTYCDKCAKVHPVSEQGACQRKWDQEYKQGKKWELAKEKQKQDEKKRKWMFVIEIYLVLWGSPKFPPPPLWWNF